jgi:hypothetical protein
MQFDLSTGYTFSDGMYADVDMLHFGMVRRIFRESDTPGVVA